MTKLKISPGIDGIPTDTIPDDPAQFASWFKNVFLSRWAANADTRNAISGPGISITGDISSPATIGVSENLQLLFEQPYVLVGAPTAPLTDYRSIIAQDSVLVLSDGGAEETLTIGVAPNGIGNAQIRQGAAVSIVGNPSAVLANVSDIVASADNTTLVRAGGLLSFSALPLSAIASVANLTVLGNSSGGTASPSALNQTQLTALIDLATTGAAGAMPQLDGNTAHFLNGAGSFATPSYPAAANPSAKVALAAVNGTATTWMPSDASPQLDQTIAPTWSSLHLFSAGVSISGATNPLLVQGVANQYSAIITASATSGQSLGLRVNAGTTAADVAFQVNSQNIASTFFQIGGTGVITVAGTVAGTPKMTLNTQATTGAKTAAMTATNKPGTNNQTTPAVWLPIICDGVTYYLPCYAA